MATDHRTRRLSPEEMFESRVNTETLNTSAATLTVCSANMTHDCFMVMSCCLSSGFRIRDEASLRHRPRSVFPILEHDFLVGKFQSGYQKRLNPFPLASCPAGRPSSLLSLGRFLPAQRQRDSHLAPDNGQFGRFPVRQCRMILSRGDAAPRPFVWPARAVEVRLPSFSAPLFMWLCVNEPSPPSLWCDLVTLPGGSDVWRVLRCSVNRVFDTACQVLSQGRGRLGHCGEE